MKNAPPDGPNVHRDLGGTIDPPGSARELGRRAFAETCDPTAYVPREAMESALSSLEQWANADGVGSTIASLVGPPGLGKTMLLRVFESRVGNRRVAGSGTRGVIYLPYAGLPPFELTIWIYGLLGRSPESAPRPLRDPAISSAEPEERGDAILLQDLLDLAPDPKDPFFLLIDDADSMPAETLRAFVHELPRQHSPLRVVLAMNEDAKASRMLAGFDSLEPRVVRLVSAMDESETDRYVAARLRWAGADSTLIERLDSDTRSRLFALSVGNPRAVHRIAGLHFEGVDAGPPGSLETKRRREDWMGRPFEDDPFEIDS